MQTYSAILLGKITHLVAKLFGLGAGGTWPGEIALKFSPRILAHLSSQIKKGIIIVAGTNGKTTTSLMITQILEVQGEKVIHNATGANLLNGVASSLIQKANLLGKIDEDWGVFEVDENSLPIVLSSLSERSESKGDLKGKPSKSSGKKFILVLLNLFRDQLDRYGEVDVIAEKWEKALKVTSQQLAVGRLYNNLNLILNADDPLIAYLGSNNKSTYSSREQHANREVFDRNKKGSRVRSNNTTYFGINDKKHFLKTKEHAVDSIFCLNCGARLMYEGIYYSHIGIWKCTACGEKRPTPHIDTWPSPLPGLYNQYNTLAAVATIKSIGIDDVEIKKTLNTFAPAFGRQEEFEIEGKKIKLFLSKNPAGFNQSLRTIVEIIENRHPGPNPGSRKLDSRLRGNDSAILLVLNDRIPDGRDVSWIWDVDFEMIPEKVNVMVSGDRVYDLALRMKYARENVVSKKNELVVEPSLEKAVQQTIASTSKDETLYILATYSAMLEVRKILSGKKIA